MRSLVLAIAVIAILSSTVGCANGPIRQWLRGAPCSACNPQFNAPAEGNFFSSASSSTCPTGNCASGVCSTGQPTGSGVLSGSFNRNQGSSISGGLPASIPASSFDNAPALTTSPGAELYGNANTVGRIELPPSPPFN